jgi:hypothetical protein
MNTEKLNELRDAVYEVLVINLNITKKPEVKNLIKSTINKIDNIRILENLKYIKYALDPINLLSTTGEISKYSDYNLCLMFLIIKCSDNSKYRYYTPLEIIEEFCEEYKHKIGLDIAALYLINNFHIFYIDMLCNEKDFLFRLTATKRMPYDY